MNHLVIKNLSGEIEGNMPLVVSPSLAIIEMFNDNSIQI